MVYVSDEISLRYLFGHSTRARTLAISYSFPLGLKRSPDGDFKMRVIRAVLLVAVGTLLSSGIVENPLQYCWSSLAAMHPPPPAASASTKASTFAKASTSANHLRQGYGGREATVDEPKENWGAGPRDALFFAVFLRATPLVPFPPAGINSTSTSSTAQAPTCLLRTTLTTQESYASEYMNPAPEA